MLNVHFNFGFFFEIYRVNFNHFLGSFIGVFAIILTQFLDAIRWAKYMKYKQMTGGVMYVLIQSYAFLCTMLAFIFDVTNHMSSVFGYVQAQWLCVLFICLGFVIQSVHMLFMHSHLKHQTPAMIDENMNVLELVPVQQSEINNVYTSTASNSTEPC